MSFQTKDFTSIVASELNLMRAVTTKITDLQPGSVARTLVEAPAVEMEELYIQMMLGLRDAIPVATFKSFGFDTLPAAYAHGYVSISKATPPSADIPIPLGTTFGTTDGRSYVSTQSVMWAAGVPVVRVPVRCTTIGAVGNVAAGGINSTGLGAGYTVSNSAITTGRDTETQAEREVRFAEFVRSLSRGTMDACRYGVSMATVLDADGNVDEYVTRVGTIEERGYVRFWVYSSKYGVPSSALLTRAQALLDGYTDASGAVVPGFRPAGVRVEALAMAERQVAMAFQVGMYPGYSLTTAVQQSIADQYASTLRATLPGTTLYLKTLVENMLAVDGVRAIVPASTENIACAPGEALVPGALTLTSL